MYSMVLISNIPVDELQLNITNLHFNPDHIVLKTLTNHFKSMG